MPVTSFVRDAAQSTETGVSAPANAAKFKFLWVPDRYLASAPANIAACASYDPYFEYEEVGTGCDGTQTFTPEGLLVECGDDNADNTWVVQALGTAQPIATSAPIWGKPTEKVFFPYDSELRASFHLKLCADYKEELNMFVGFQGTAADPIPDVTTHDDYFGFWWINSATNWAGVTGNAGTDASTDLGYAFTELEELYLDVVLDATYKPNFYINGTLMATGAAMRDIAAEHFTPTIALGRTGTAHNVGVTIKSIYLEKPW